MCSQRLSRRVRSENMEAPHISWPTLGFFRRIVRGYFRRHFHAVRVSGPERLVAAGAGDRPLIVYANHSSWWDPMVQVLLGAELLAQRRHYAPMDAAALERYSIFKQLGVFGVEMKTARGAAQFLRTGLAVLESGGVLWITPQGRFADVRDRPLGFKPGLAALAGRVKDGCTVLPLAIEYTFWDERLPETLLHFGEVVQVDGLAPDLEDRLESALLKAMEELEGLSVARDPAGFCVLRAGRVGVGGFYGLGQRLLAWLGRRPYQAEHRTAVARQAARNERA
jgi:1-acyl-sn-glycerol-3-phosphate acyltransferase